MTCIDKKKMAILLIDQYESKEVVEQNQKYGKDLWPDI